MQLLEDVALSFLTLLLFDIYFHVAFWVLTLSFIHKKENSSNFLHSYQQSPDVATHPSLLSRTQQPLLDTNSQERDEEPNLQLERWLVAKPCCWQ